MLISFKKTQKMTRLKSPSLESLNMQKLFFKKESLCLMHRLSTFLILFPSNVSPNMQLKKKKFCPKSLNTYTTEINNIKT